MSLTSSPPSISPRQSHTDLIYQQYYRKPASLSSSPGSSTSYNHAVPSSQTSSGLSSPDRSRSRSNTINTSTGGFPAKPNVIRSTSTRSAPTSPSGRLVMQGLTPLNNISTLPSDATPTYSQGSQKVYAQRLSQQQQSQGLMGPPATLPSQYNLNQQRPPQFHSHSLPPANPLLTLPVSGSNQQPSPAHISLAGPSRQQSYPNAIPIPIPSNSSHMPSAKSITRTRPRQSFSSAWSHGEDSGLDSDATVRPGSKGDMSRHKGSLSQPDLTVLRSKRVEGWAGHMRSEGGPTKTPIPQADIPSGGEIKRRSSGHRQKTPPSSYSKTPPSDKEGWLPASPSRSYSSLSSLRKSPSSSPRSSQLNIPTMSPIIPNRVITPLSNSSSEDEEYVSLISSGINRTSSSLERGSSEDADDDYESTSTSTNSPGGSSGSITFSPKRTKRFGSSGNLRSRFPLDRKGSYPSISSTSTTSNDAGGLGLNLNGDTSETITAKTDKTTSSMENTSKSKGLVEKFEDFFRNSTLLPLRLLAIIPSLWGICVLVEALITGGLWVDVWPWGVDLSREALERLVAGGENTEGVWRSCDRGDAILCIAWAICTAHFCFSLTTGLTHRWRSYYSLPSTITRLVSLQCLCWPATYLTLWFLGAKRLLLCWVVIGVTTGWSRTIQMWVTSNVIPSNTIKEQDKNNLDNGGGGDTTPNLKNINLIGPPEIPDGLSTWESFKWGRKWDWDKIAREVIWKIGFLLLVTCAWLFWGIEKGMKVRG
ncbi:uncharacterized protein I206_107115 [Kwoniella pini CBS 10737]|uniref:Uncharacterized protein n=1 Tax=Kwoniella pini CBS 10737 TaxID=1296096 RepID=A0A1B9HZ59_9TREE|nr:uncharacterized protein I206_05341 [Kwoniella pini CBS 10737]OCF48562.1 hypothetical protein I206_05341 [Kwoniella pini CBS 10737]